jgi:hypothetical protein
LLPLPSWSVAGANEDVVLVVVVVVVVVVVWEEGCSTWTLVQIQQERWICQREDGVKIVIMANQRVAIVR